jgi:hypothetical protein
MKYGLLAFLFFGAIAYGQATWEADMQTASLLQKEGRYFEA